MNHNLGPGELHLGCLKWDYLSGKGEIGFSLWCKKQVGIISYQAETACWNVHVFVTELKHMN